MQDPVLLTLIIIYIVLHIPQAGAMVYPHIPRTRFHIGGLDTTQLYLLIDIDRITLSREHEAGNGDQAQRIRDVINPIIDIILAMACGDYIYISDIYLLVCTLYYIVDVYIVVMVFFIHCVYICIVTGFWMGGKISILVIFIFIFFFGVGIVPLVDAD